MTGLGPLEPLLKDPTHHRHPDQRPRMRLRRARRPARAAAACASRTRRICCASSTRSSSAVGRRVDESHPLCDARLLDGSRVNVAVRPIGVDGPLVSIRKFSKKPFNLNKLVEIGAITPQMAEVLAAAVKARITHDHLRRHRLRQDHDAQRAVGLHLREGAPDHHRGRRRTAVAAAACRRAWKRARPTSRARAKSASASWSRTRCACGPTASSSASAAARKPSTCCRP